MSKHLEYAPYLKEEEAIRVLCCVQRVPLPLLPPEEPCTLLACEFRRNLRSKSNELYSRWLAHWLQSASWSGATPGLTPEMSCSTPHSWL